VIGSFFISLLLLPTEKAQADSILLDDFATWRNGYCGDIVKLFDVYNGAIGDAGPNQSALGISNNTFRTSVPAGNVWYVDQDDADYTSTNC
jgi:hypothetical protein